MKCRFILHRCYIIVTRVARCFVFKPKIGKFGRVLQWKMMVYFMDTWSILRSFVIFYEHLVQFVVIWYIFPVLVFFIKKNLATLIVTWSIVCTCVKQGCQMVYFQTKNPNLGLFCRAFDWENVGIFYDHLKYVKAIWHNLRPFSKVCSHLVYFSQFGMFGPRKIWQPWWQDVEKWNREVSLHMYIHSWILWFCTTIINLGISISLNEAGFSSNEFPNCATETIEGRPFQR
jgi:hypothetical protein